MIGAEQCKHENGLCGLVGDPIFSCADCGAKVNVPERDAIRRAERAEAEVDRLRTGIQVIVGYEWGHPPKIPEHQKLWRDLYALVSATPLHGTERKDGV